MEINTIKVNNKYGNIPKLIGIGYSSFLLWSCNSVSVDMKQPSHGKYKESLVADHTQASSSMLHKFFELGLMTNEKELTIDELQQALGSIIDLADQISVLTHDLLRCIPPTHKIVYLPTSKNEDNTNLSLGVCGTCIGGGLVSMSCASSFPMAKAALLFACPIGLLLSFPALAVTHCILNARTQAKGHSRLDLEGRILILNSAIQEALKGISPREITEETIRAIKINFNELLTWAVSVAEAVIKYRITHTIPLQKEKIIFNKDKDFLQEIGPAIDQRDKDLLQKVEWMMKELEVHLKKIEQKEKENKRNKADDQQEHEIDAQLALYGINEPKPFTITRDKTVGEIAAELLPVLRLVQERISFVDLS